MKFGILGPLSVIGQDVEVDLGPPQRKAVLALLACSPNRPVSTDRMIDSIWGDEGSNASSGLQAHISRLRKLVGADRIITRQGGYMLAVEPEDLDVANFERLAAEGLIERAEHLFPAFVEHSPHGADSNWSALYQLKASLMVSIGMGESALAVARQAVSSAERSGSPDRICEARATLSKALRTVSRFAEAMEEASLASISGRQVAPHFAAAASLARGLAILATDGPDSAIPVLIGARDELEHGDQGGFFEAVGALALAHLINGREPAAVPYLLQALGRSPAELVPGLLEISAAVLHRLGDAESAIRAKTSAVRLRRQSGQVVEPWIETALRDQMPVTETEGLDSEVEELDTSFVIEETRRALQRTSLKKGLAFGSG